jgi:3-hydroxyisobutyrate dehydrogenase-like beta-hydroxyacid dehydrogenase
MRVGVIGAGAMGRPISASWLATVHSAIVYNRMRSRTDELRSPGAEVADTIREACHSQVVITVLADDPALENVAFESGEFFSSFPVDGIHVSASTVSLSLAKRLAESHAERAAIYRCSDCGPPRDGCVSADLVVSRWRSHPPTSGLP